MVCIQKYTSFVCVCVAIWSEIAIDPTRMTRLRKTHELNNILLKTTYKTDIMVYV